MIWLGFILLSLVIMLPVLAAQGRVSLRGRREAALALYRRQLQELGEEAARGRIPPREAAEARLEIERRLLAAGEGDGQGPVAAAASPPRWHSWRLTLLVPLLPFAALVLYLQGGAPMLPAAPLAPRLAALAAKRTEDETLLRLLRARIAELDPKSEAARQGYVLLGKLQADMGDAAGAAAAWGQALAIRADPGLAHMQAAAAAIARKEAQNP
ncbi:c-type cytochrome biogenesis protein CcmI [Acidisoma sp. C75]